MEAVPDRLEIRNLPPYIESWAVAKVKGFVPAILSRWWRSHPSLPNHVVLIMCPVTEINARGGLPARIHAITDPRLTCKHFTGCSRPYFAIIFTDAEVADERRAEIQSILPWSEAYSVEILQDRIVMDFIDASEDLEIENEGLPLRRVADLLESGELLQILA